MVHFLYGRAGSGKSYEVFERIAVCLAQGKPCLLLVPEQQAVISEKHAASRFAGMNTFSLEILNFKRLANHVFRQAGGLFGQSIDGNGKRILMWRILASLIPFLKEYQNVSPADTSLIDLLLRTCESLRQRRITPYALERAAQRTEDEKLKNKLEDISLILASFTSLLKEEYADVEENADRLIALLSEKTVFDGVHVFVDSFDGFTEQEYAILSHLFRQAEEVTLTLNLDVSDTSPLFDSTRKTRSQLLRLADRYDETSLKGGHAFASPSLAFLEKHFPASRLSKEKGVCGGDIRIVECADAYDECLFAAEEIAKAVRNGGCYRDFAVICRDTSRYEGLIDFAFEESGIPLFTSRRVNIGEKAVVKYIFTALAILKNGWRQEDVISHLRTGLTSLSLAECDILEEYIRRWRISARQWKSEEDWMANPDGYRPHNEKSFAKLQQINDIRRRLADPLIKLHESFRLPFTVREACQALYVFLSENSIAERLKEQATRLGSEGEDGQLWAYLMSALDKLVLTAGDCETDSEGFASLLKMLLTGTDIGVLPTSTDQVLFGSASALRTDSVKHTFILGANSGVFPADPHEDGLFSDREKREIEQGGLPFLPESAEQAEKELFFFYRASCSASDRLTYVYAAREEGKPASPCRFLPKIAAMFDGLEVERHADLPLLERAITGDPSLSLMREHPASPVGRALRSLYEEDEARRELLRIADRPLSLTQVTLSEQTAETLFGGDITLSQSKTDTYVSCPFSFFAKYVLRAEQKGENTLSYAEIGNYYHHVLDKALSALFADGSFDAALYEKEGEALVESLTNDYIRLICPDPTPDKRLLALMTRLKRVSSLLLSDLAAEFSQSQFRPILFEQKIDERHIPPFTCLLPDGSRLSMQGIADRVDVYETEQDLYVRVVDYKSGSKVFSLTDVAAGLNLQTLVYLFSLWKNYPTDKNVLPAAASYHSANIPMLSVVSGTDAEQVLQLAANRIVRSGCYLADEEILRKMDKNLDGRFLPVKIGKEGELKSTSSLATLEQFGRLMGQVSDTLSQIGLRMKSGDMSARPLKDDRHDGCAYCSFKAVCRRKEEQEHEIMD